MESINPTLHLCLTLRHQLQMGLSVKAALKKHLESASDELAEEIPLWIHLWEKEGCLNQIQHSSIYRQNLVMLIERGLGGDSILSQLQSLEEEVYLACHEEIDLHMKRLPYLLMIPLLLFQFPAYLILLIGPFLVQFLNGF